MKKSFTDNHNIRKSFGKIPDLVDMPNLLEIQKNSYDLFLQKDVKPNEEIVEEKGVKVFIDPKAIIYLLGTEMDYKQEKFSSQFIFKNPNETERCGCGESFKV